MKVLLTGGTGFIGANLVRHLLNRGDEVVCLVRQSNLCLDGLDVRIAKAPLSDVEALARAMEGCEGVYHVAGLFDPSPGGQRRMVDVHVRGTRNLLLAAEKVGARRVVVCSSSVTVGYGPRSAPGDETTPFDPRAIYGAAGPLWTYYSSKRQAEVMVERWGGPVEAVTVCPDYIIGAWDIKPTSGQLIVTMARRHVPVYPTGGKCFMDADDCALGHILAMERGTPGERYLLGVHNLSYLEFMTLVAEVVGRVPPRLPVPGAALWAGGVAGRIMSRIDEHKFAGLDGDVLRSMRQERYRSGSKALEQLGVGQTDIRVAVEKAYRWFRDHGYC